MNIRHGLAVAAMTLAVGTASAAVVGGFAGGRTLSGGYSVYDANGANTQLNSAANAALYGGSISFAASTTLVTDAYLAGVDIFFTGLINFDGQALSPAEVTSLVNFINGGGVVIAHGDNTSFDETVDALLNAFGLDVVNTSHNGGATTVDITAATHPVMNGPFGAVGDHDIQDSAHLSTTVGAGGGQLLAEYAGGAFGAIGAVGPGGARVGGLVFLPDSESYGLQDADFRGITEARRVFNNAVAWAVGITDDGGGPNPAPAPGTLALAGLALLGLARRSGARR